MSLTVRLSILKRAVSNLEVGMPGQKTQKIGMHIGLKQNVLK